MAAKKAGATPDFMQQGADCFREYYGFIADRLRKDAEFGQELMGCRQPMAAFSLWSDFGKEVVSDYQAEVQKLQAMTAEALAASMAGAQGLVEKGIGFAESTPAKA